MNSINAVAKKYNSQLKAKILFIQFLVMTCSCAFAQGTSKIIELYQEQADILRLQLSIAIQFCFVTGSVCILTMIYFIFENQIEKALYFIYQYISKILNK